MKIRWGIGIPVANEPFAMASLEDGGSKRPLACRWIAELADRLNLNPGASIPLRYMKQTGMGNVPAPLQ